MIDSSCISQADRLAGGLYGSLIGDALTLAVHWNYDPEAIERQFGRITDYRDPTTNPFHGSGRKKAGDGTHYGDQAIALMQSISASDGFSQRDFAHYWRAMWQGYRGYMDKATKTTLKNGQGNSDDLAGAARIAPLVVAMAQADRDELLIAVKSQTAFTHGDPATIDCSIYFALACRELLDGKSVPEALRAASAAEAYQSISPAALLEEVEADLALPVGVAIQKRGLACPVRNALPATLYLIRKNEHSPEQALVENAMAGGDSAARGLVIGLMLGLRYGIGGIPERWVRGLSSGGLVAEWLDGFGITAR